MLDTLKELVAKLAPLSLLCAVCVYAALSVSEPERDEG